MVFLEEPVDTYMYKASYVPWHSYESIDWKKTMQQYVLKKNVSFPEKDDVCIYTFGEETWLYALPYEWNNRTKKHNFWEVESFLSNKCYAEK